MELFFFILFFVVLVMIIVQDNLSRTIHWILLPILTISILGMKNFEIQIKELILNVLFLIGTLIFLWLYIRIRTGKFQNITQYHFGLGDILFLLAITPLSSFVRFIPLFTIGTLFALLLGLTVNYLTKQETIPYAGNFSIILVSIILLEKFIPSFTFFKIFVG